MFKIIKSRKEYNDFLCQFPTELQDSYFFYEYSDLYIKAPGDEVIAATYRTKRGGLIFYSFIRSNILNTVLENERCYDIASCYGYSGPIVYGCNRVEIDDFEKKFNEWCIRNNIIAEFIRFHPLYSNYHIFRQGIKVEMNRQTVVVDLEDADINKVWMEQIDSKNRNQIRKAIKLGVTIKIDSNLEPFIGLYRSTMKRLNSEQFYMFDKTYYEKLGKWDPKNYCVIYALYRNQCIAGAVFLTSKDNIHYHLSGSLKEYQSLCANNLILFRAIELGIERGCKKFHLGGGRSAAEGDSLLRFKKSFSKNAGIFYIGKRVHNEKKYRQLMENWKKKNNQQASLFLQYRQ